METDNIRQLLADLRSFDKEKRRTAVIKLGLLGGDVAIRQLIVIVGNTQEDLIARGRAALMLGKIRDMRAVEPLIQALDAPGFQTPVYAAEALGKIGDPRAIDPLLAAMQLGNDTFRKVAQEALRRLGHQEPEPA